MAKVRVQMGGRYFDDVTGFVGTATARCVYLSRAVEVRLERGTDDGDKVVTEWFAEERLRVLGALAPNGEG